MLSLLSIDARRSASAASTSSVVACESVLSAGFLMERVPASGTVVRMSPASTSTVNATTTEPEPSRPVIALVCEFVCQVTIPSALEASLASSAPSCCSSVVVSESVGPELHALMDATRYKAIGAMSGFVCMWIVKLLLYVLLCVGWVWRNGRKNPLTDSSSVCRLVVMCVLSYLRESGEVQVASRVGSLVHSSWASHRLKLSAGLICLLQVERELQSSTLCTMV